MKKIIYLSILLVLLIPFYHAFAHDTDLYVLDQSMQQVPPDALIILDLSLTMDYPPPGGKLYALDGSNCSTYNGPFYHAQATGRTKVCTWDSASAASSPYWGDSESCSGPFYKTSGMKGSPGIDFSTNCRRLKLQRGLFLNFLMRTEIKLLEKTLRIIIRTKAH